jgi:hypothetical protein
LSGLGFHRPNADSASVPTMARRVERWNGERMRRSPF